MAKPQLSTSSGYSSNSKLVKVGDLFVLMKSRVEEAEILLANGKYDAASYLCGYAVELALKIRICENFRWSEYPPSRQTSTQPASTQTSRQTSTQPALTQKSGGGECDQTYKRLYEEFVKTHNLYQLLCLSGITKKDIDAAGLDDKWKTVTTNWDPENRYSISVTQQDAEEMIEAVKNLLKMFLGTII